MNKILTTILLTICYFGSNAQGSFLSQNGMFSADYLKGCTGTTITLTPQSNTGTFFFCFDGDPQNPGGPENQSCFNEQANKPEKLSFTYDAPGTYVIVGFRQITNSQTFDSLRIEIIDPSLPALSAVNCGGSINFDLNTTEETFNFYSIDFGDGSAVSEFSINQFPVNHIFPDNNGNYTVNINARLDNNGFNNCSNNSVSFSIRPADLMEEAATINNIDLTTANSFTIDYTLNSNQNYYLQLKQNFNGSYSNQIYISGETNGSYTFTGLELDNNFYCARIISPSQCGNSDLVSNEVCTILFQPSATQNGNLINWNSAQFESTSLFRNGELISNGPTPYLDTNVLCGQVDSYYVEATDANGITQTSITSDITALFGNPTSGIEQISLITLSDNEMAISWEIPAGLQPEKYIIFKRRNANGDFFPIDSSRTQEYVDIGIDFTSKVFTYGISYTNSCGGKSTVTNVASNILLKLAVNENNITLNWNRYTGYPGQFNEYILRQYDDNMNLINSFNLQDSTFSLNTAQSDIQKFNFRVEAHSTSGAISLSNIISYKIPSTFFVPSAFSPDGNGLNEEIRVLGKFIDQIEFSIYNRWGNLIFKSNQLELGWDGYLQDRESPEGSYSYIVTITDQYGETYVKSGIFNLIR